MESSFFAHAIFDGERLEVADEGSDPGFANQPCSSRQRNGFSATALILCSESLYLGALRVMDRTRWRLTDTPVVVRQGSHDVLLVCRDAQESIAREIIKTTDAACVEVPVAFTLGPAISHPSMSLAGAIVAADGRLNEHGRLARGN